MSSKQDLVAARTASDIERKYNFGKTFAEVMGMADEAQRAAEKAQQAADTATEAVGDLDQDAIFNLLTNNGEIKGLFMKDGQLYINASYLVTGIIKSENGKLVIDLSGESEPTFNTGISTNGLIIRGDEADAKKLFTVEAREYLGAYLAELYLNSVNGKNLFRITETFAGAGIDDPSGVAMELFNQENNKSFLVSVGKNNGGAFLKNGESYVGSFTVTSAGKSALASDIINDKAISWKDNGDGTFTLIGQ